MASASKGPAYAFVTLVTTDEYLPAALVTAHSLRLAHAQSSLLSKQDRVSLVGHDEDNSPIPQLGPWRKGDDTPIAARSNIDLVALVTPATVSIQTIRVLLTVFDRVIGVESLGIETILAMQQLGQIKTGDDDQPIHEVISRRNHDNLALLGRLDLGSSRGAALTKLHAWRLTDYEKIVYLDADTLVLNPVAHLFTLSHAFAAAPDTGWPDIFNSGVMLLTPSEDVFIGLIELAAATGSWDGADQGLINEYFGGEIGSGNEGQGGGWARLGFLYNTTALGGYTYAPAFRRFGAKVNIAHFIGENKPWRNRPSSTSLASRPGRPTNYNSHDNENMAVRWWDVYNSYYPVSNDESASENDSDLEVKITENGVEIVARPKAQTLSIPTFQSAWESVAKERPVARTGTTVDELKRMFYNQAGAKIEPGRASEGQYESLPLFGRIDLLPPVFDFAAARRATTPPTPTPTQSPQPQDPPALATVTIPPPSIERPSGPQMRNPIDTFYPNAWDQPVDPQAEADRRRQYFNANARAQAEGREWGYIPPEAKEIHTFSHLGGDKPDEQKVKAIFPWEERGEKGQRRSPPPSQHYPRRDYQAQTESDPSLGGGAGRSSATRRFDNYVVPNSTADTAAYGVVNGSLVARYGNVWDEQQFIPVYHQGREVAEEPERHAFTSTSTGHTTRRRHAKGSDGSSAPRSRPTSHYIPNNYDKYAPPQPYHPSQSHNLSKTPASDYSVDDSIQDEQNYPLQLGGGGGAAGMGGFGEVEGSSSWTSNLTDIIRLGKGAGTYSLGRGASAAHGRGRHLGHSSAGSQSRYRGDEDDDGDDESSTEEVDSGNPGDRRSRQATYGDLSPPLGKASVTSTATSPSLSSPTGGDLGGSAFESFGVTASSLAVPIPYPREGPGYNRKSQQTEHARSKATPRSPRPGASSASISSSSPSSGTSIVERSGGWIQNLDEAVTRSAEGPGPGPVLTGRARIRPEKMAGGGRGGGVAGSPSLE